MVLEHLFLIVKPIKMEMNIANEKIYFIALVSIGFLIKKTKTNQCKRGALCLCSRCVIVAHLKWILSESSGVRGRCKMQPCFLPGSGPSLFLQGPRFLSCPSLLRMKYFSKFQHLFDSLHSISCNHCVIRHLN